jgi:peptidoglycan L-alanyl-D-glutamate endopeptidase CwlK
MPTVIRSMPTTQIPPQPAVPPTTPPPAVALPPAPELVHQLFPFTPLANIAANLPYVLAALASASLADKPMLLMALATIRAEAEPFLPLTEAESPFNTSPGGQPFDLYDRRRDLGNLAPPDGASFRGRGFVQLTGRANYTRYAQQINQPLVANPTLAASPAIAAQLLACFLAAREPAIRRALAANDLATARRLVNGGTNGLDRFTAAYTAGSRLLKP